MNENAENIPMNDEPKVTPEKMMMDREPLNIEIKFGGQDRKFSSVQEAIAFMESYNDRDNR